MRLNLTDVVHAALARFASESRLYALSIGDDPTAVDHAGLMVEAFVADDAIQTIGDPDVIAVSSSYVYKN